MANTMMREEGYVVVRRRLPAALAQQLFAQASRKSTVYNPIFNKFVAPTTTDSSAGTATGERSQVSMRGRQAKLRGVLLAALRTHARTQDSHRLRRLVFLRRTTGCRKQHTHRDADSGYFVVAPLTPNYSIGVVPGSHRPGRDRELGAATWLQLQVGDVFIGDARVLHSGGGNADAAPAYSVHAFYHTADTPLAYSKTIPPSAERLDRMHTLELD